MTFKEYIQRQCEVRPRKAVAAAFGVTDSIVYYWIRGVRNIGVNTVGQILGGMRALTPAITDAEAYAIFCGRTLGAYDSFREILIQQMFVRGMSRKELAYVSGIPYDRLNYMMAPRRQRVLIRDGEMNGITAATGVDAREIMRYCEVIA